MDCPNFYILLKGSEKMGRQAKDLTGERFGNLIVLQREGSTADGHALWKCECQCEKKKVVYKSSNALKRGTPSCGCLVSKLISEAARKQYNDLTEQRFGRLVAKEYIKIDKPGAWWRCECDCGNKHFITTAHHLTSKNTQSCGCLQKEKTRIANQSEDLTGKKYGRLTVI